MFIYIYLLFQFNLSFPFHLNICLILGLPNIFIYLNVVRVLWLQPFFFFITVRVFINANIAHYVLFFTGLCVLFFFPQCFSVYPQSLVGSVSRGLPGTSVISKPASCAGFPAEGNAGLRANAPGSESARAITSSGQPGE